MSIRWNSLGQQYKNFSKSPFYDRLFPTQQKRFTSALGLNGSRAAERHIRDPKGAKIKSAGFYQEDLAADRIWCDATFEVIAQKLGSPKSIVVQGYLAGDPQKFASVLLRHLNSSVIDIITYHLDRDGNRIPTKEWHLDPDRCGWVDWTCWKDVKDPRTINHDDVLQAINNSWDWATSARSKKEVDAEVHSLEMAARGDNAGRKVQVTKKHSRPGNIFKGAAVLNAKQAARQGEVQPT